MKRDSNYGLGRTFGGLVLIPMIFGVIIVLFVIDRVFQAIGLGAYGGPVIFGLIILSIVGWFWYRFIRPRPGKK